MGSLRKSKGAVRACLTIENNDLIKFSGLNVDSQRGVPLPHWGPKRLMEVLSDPETIVGAEEVKRGGRSVPLLRKLI